MRANPNWLVWFFLLGIIVASALIIAAPNTPAWGERHTYDASKGSIRLNPGKTVEQTFTSEFALLDTVLVWLDPQRLPPTGVLTLRIEGKDVAAATQLALRDIPASGTAAFALPHPVRLGTGTSAKLQLQLTETTQPVYLFFQIGGTLYRGGELAHRAGDLGFQLRYLRPPLGARSYHWLAGMLLLVAGSIVGWLLRATLRQPLTITLSLRRDALVALCIAGAVAAWYGFFIIHPDTWISPGDFVKDVAYVQASAQALQQGAWPIWSHLICGGLPLLANPESNTLSLATLLATIMPSAQALLTLLALEAGIAAAGTFALARSFHVSRIAAVMAAAIAAISPAYAYRLGEGFSMTGGAVAFTPWVLLGFFHAVRHRRWWGALLAGAGLGLIFWRGEVHIIVGVIMVLGLWTIISSLTQRGVRPLGVLLGIAAVTAVMASPKLLAYGEHDALFTSHLKPYVVRLWDAGLLDDIFFTAPDRTVKVVVRYGTEESWGNFGSYTGWLPWILAAVGLISRSRLRWWLLAGAAGLLVLAEGTLFDYVLRPLGPLGVLLRLPTRVLSIFLVLLGIGAGLGTTTFQRIGGWPGRLLALVLTAAIIVDLGMVTSHLLRQSFSEHSALRLPPPTTTTQFADHQNISENSSRHSAVLLASNYLLPNLCADLNIDRPFAVDQPPTYALATVPAEVTANGIVLHDPPPAGDVYVNENFISSWVVDHGIVLESSTNAVHVITPPEPKSRLTLRVVSGLRRSQQALLIVLLCTAVGVIAHWWRQRRVT